MIAKTTKEVKDEDGETWGIVLGGKPIKLSEIAEEIGSSERTIQRNIVRLKKFGYIKATKAPYGDIFKVKNSKKFYKNRHDKSVVPDSKRHDKSGMSLEERDDKYGMSEPRDTTDLVERHDKSGMSNKIKKDKEIKDINNNNKIKKKNEDVDMKHNPITEYEKSFGFPPAILIQEFSFWIDSEESFFQEPEAIICEVIKQARKQAPRNAASYVKAIIKKYHDMELYTLEAVQEYNKKFEEKRNGGGQYGNGFSHNTKQATGTSETESNGTPVGRVRRREV
ncbi:phage-like element PBSX protein XkdB [Niallia sp. NCCP-28]|nr:phage-like element PBSX protein XkdB [Niallia sp. NCCP-28]